MKNETNTAAKEVRYYGFKPTGDGRLGMLLDTRVDTKSISKTWTGDYWPNTSKGWKAANAECLRRNIILDREARS